MVLKKRTPKPSKRSRWICGSAKGKAPVPGRGSRRKQNTTSSDGRQLADEVQLPRRSLRLSSLARSALQGEKDVLVEKITSLSGRSDALRTRLVKDGTSLSFLDYGIIIKLNQVDMSNSMDVRNYHDLNREIGRLQYDLTKIEFLLSPPKGRPPERIYDQALSERLDNPNLTPHQLAECHFPFYFPERADAAIRMMDQGLRRATRRAMKQRTPSK
jgi:hypothetical protein